MTEPIISKLAGLPTWSDLNNFSENEKLLIPVSTPYLTRTYNDPYREQRNHFWLTMALANYWEKADSYAICRLWSQFTDVLVAEIFSQYFDTTQVALLALGKWGSEELNLSSDIDLIILAHSEAEKWIPAARKFKQHLEEKTPEGFLYRIDFDLRPGGKHSPLVPSLDQFCDYYQNYGENWERLALLRLRPICGSPELIKACLELRQGFCFRRHLDYSLFEDLKNLRGKIQNNISERTARGELFSKENSTNSPVNLKLHPGAIRDIELFVHSLQIIHGGRHQGLRSHSTKEMMSALKSLKILPSQDLDFLESLFWKLRWLENIAQSIGDTQTHVIDWSTLTTLSSDSSRIENKYKTCISSLSKSDAIVSGIIGKSTIPRAKNLSSEDQGLLQATLNEIGEIPILSRHKSRDLVARENFLHNFITYLNEFQSPKQTALHFLKDFCRAVRAKASFFSLLNHYPELIRDLAWLFGKSPYLSRIICLRPELLDSLIYRSMESGSTDPETLLTQLSEKKLLGEVLAGIEFLKTGHMQNLTQGLSSLADEIIHSIQKNLGAENLNILCLGKWGGQEIGFRSDLDFIILTNHEATETDLKIARQLVTRISVPHRGGSLYEIDLRLRPTGRAGPMVMAFTELNNYCAELSEHKIQAWEKQAYLKGRFLNLNTHTGILPLPWNQYISKALSISEIIELKSIGEKLSSNRTDIKLCPGGLIDIELAVQTYLLSQKLKPSNSNICQMLDQLPASLGKKLQDNYLFLRSLEQYLHLFGLKPNELFSEFAQTHFATLNNDRFINLKENLQTVLDENLKILSQFDPRRGY